MVNVYKLIARRAEISLVSNGERKGYRTDSGLLVLTAEDAVKFSENLAALIDVGAIEPVQVN